ncbi:MAG: hypothetical protein WCF45_10715 [Photobacterium halotolerans]
MKQSEARAMARRMTAWSWWLMLVVCLMSIILPDMPVTIGPFMSLYLITGSNIALRRDLPPDESLWMIAVWPWRLKRRKN